MDLSCFPVLRRAVSRPACRSRPWCRDGHSRLGGPASRPGSSALCSPHLPFCHGQTREQGWSEAPCMHARTHTTSPRPCPLLEPSETAPQAGAVLPGGGAGDCLVCDLIKGRGRTHRWWQAGQLVTMTRPGASYTLWSSAQEPGPFLPHTSMPRSRGPEHVAKAPHVPCHSPDHPGGDVA